MFDWRLILLGVFCVLLGFVLGSFGAAPAASAQPGDNRPAWGVGDLLHHRAGISS